MTRRWQGVVAVAVMTGLLSGCFGKFGLTRKVYQFNREVSKDKWIRSIATFALFAVPVYEVAGLADWLVLNTVEFWSGTNPTDEPARKRSDVWERGGDRVVQNLRRTADGFVMEVSAIRGGAPLYALTARLAGRRMERETRWPDGRVERATGILPSEGEVALLK